MIETILFRLVGFFAGVFPILLCVVFGPSPMYSSRGWGDCEIDKVFPVTPPEWLQNPYNPYDCVFGPVRIVLAIAMFGAVFALSGVLTVKAGRSRSTIFGLVPAAITVTCILGLLALGRDYLPGPTAVLGSTILVSTIGLAALGAHLATRGD